MVDTAEVVAGVKHCTGLMYTDSYILECVPLLISSINTKTFHIISLNSVESMLDCY